MELREEARHRWTPILSALIGEEYTTGKHGPCPACGGKDRFRYSNKDGNGEYFCSQCGHGDGADLLMKYHRWTFRETADQVRRLIGTVQAEPVRKMPDPRIRIRKTLGKCSRAGRQVQRYLQQRGLPEIRANLGEATLQYYGDGIYPAMVAKFLTPAGELSTLHVTYLDGGGKAQVESPRKIFPPMRPMKGGAVRLFPQKPRIGIAEGIETALAASVIYEMPVWACLNANMLEQFEPPAGVNEVIIFGDNDKSATGQAAAYGLAKRLASKGVKWAVQVPHTPGTDYLDVWNSAVRACQGGG